MNYRPFICVSGSEDRSIGMYKGLPFDFTKALQEHSNYVNDIRYSPSGKVFASVSSDKKIIIFETETGNKIKELSDEKNKHKGTIISLFWISEEKLLTASLDKTCKIWDVNNSTVIATMATKEDKLEVEDMNAACGALGEEVMFSITLNGKINVWNMIELPKDSDHILTPSKVIGGTDRKSVV